MIRVSLTIYARYLSIGVINTLIHGLAFALLHLWMGIVQVLSNVLAFFIALSFSFLANGRFTFRARLTVRRYVAYIIAMGSLSGALGYLGDREAWPALLTYVLFSLCSLVLGFIYARWLFQNGRSWISR